MASQLTCPSCKIYLAIPDVHAGQRLACPSCGHILDIAVSVHQVSATDDFEEMAQFAARDCQVTGAKVGLQQARFGTYSLLGAAALVGITATISPPFLNLEPIK